MGQQPFRRGQLMGQ